MRSYIYLLLAVFVVSGCASTQKNRIIGSEKIIEKSENSRPDWLLKPWYEKGDMLYYSGGVTGKNNYELSLRQAKAEAIKNLTEGVQIKVRTEFSEAIRGTNVSENDIGVFVQDSIGMVTENLNIQGIIPKTQYYEKLERTTAVGVEYIWNSYVLISIKKDDYIQARNLAIKGIADAAKQENNKKAEEAASLLMDRLIQ